jgi:hypothetical protein
VKRIHGYVEVTVAACLLVEDGTILDHDMADVTVAFGLPTVQPPRELTEAEVKETIRLNLGRVAAMIEAVFLANGAEHLGQVEDPMTAHGREVGRSRTEPVRVVLHDAPKAQA